MLTAVGAHTREGILESQPPRMEVARHSLLRVFLFLSRASSLSLLAPQACDPSPLSLLQAVKLTRSHGVPIRDNNQDQSCRAPPPTISVSLTLSLGALL